MSIAELAFPWTLSLTRSVSMSIYSIYKITNLTNQKLYIGKTVKSIEYRFNRHCYESFKLNSNLAIHKAIRKYGIENFKIETIFNVFVEEDLNHFEIMFIKEFNSCILEPNSFGYNLSYGGEGFNSITAKIARNKHSLDYINPWAGEKGSEMTSKNNKERILNGTNPWFGEKGSELAKKKTAERLKEGTHPFQNKQKARERALLKIKNGTHLNQQFYICPHCQKQGIGRTMFRWHFNNCKKKLL